MTDALDQARRARFLAWFEVTYTAKGKGRPDFMRDSAQAGDQPLTKGRVSQYFDERQPFGEDAARNLARRFNLPEDRFLRDWTDPQHLLTGVATHTEAHSMSHFQPMLIPQQVPWEALAMEAVPERFTLEVLDDAVAPALQKGGKAICERASSARPNDLIVVVDVEGHAYLRRMQVGRVGQWQAVADTAGYLPLESERDGLRVIARVVGALWP